MKRHPKFIEASGCVRKQSKLIRRARRLYIAFCTDAILTDPTNATINQVAETLVENGLYVGPHLRCVRHGILGHMMRHEIKRGSFTPNRGTWKWNEWLTFRGWYAYSGERSAKLKAVA